jgi:hypothetical protein
MEWLSTMQSGTAWALVVAVFVVCAMAYGVAYLLVKYFKGFKRLHVGNINLEKDGSVRVKHSSLADEEIDRIAERIAAKVTHDCGQRDVIRQLVAGHGKIIDSSLVCLRFAKAQGANGEVARAIDGLSEHREEFNSVLQAQAVG